MRIFRRSGIFVLALLAAAALSCVAAPSAGRFSRVPPGVTVGALPIGGFTSEEARALVRERLSAPLEFELDGRTWTATPKELGVSASVGEAIAGALAGRTGGEGSTARPSSHSRRDRGRRPDRAARADPPRPPPRRGKASSRRRDRD